MYIYTNITNIYIYIYKYINTFDIYNICIYIYKYYIYIYTVLRRFLSKPKSNGFFKNYFFERTILSHFIIKA